MNIDISRDQVEDLLTRTTPKSQEVCVQLTKEGSMRFCGDQHNEKWEWNFDCLREKFPTTLRLYYFYLGIKGLNARITKARGF